MEELASKAMVTPNKIPTVGEAMEEGNPPSAQVNYEISKKNRKIIFSKFANHSRYIRFNIIFNCKHLQQWKIFVERI